MSESKKVKSNKANIVNPHEDENKEAIKTLVIGCRIAQEKGVYTLEEARTIMNSIDLLNSNK